MLLTVVGINRILNNIGDATIIFFVVELLTFFFEEKDFTIIFVFKYLIDYFI